MFGLYGIVQYLCMYRGASHKVSKKLKKEMKMENTESFISSLFQVLFFLFFCFFSTTYYIVLFHMHGLSFYFCIWL
jgi:hypothetical protein